MAEKIIVLERFDDPMIASLAKSKLDAHDIPNFLSNENFSHLRPFYGAVSQGIGLHIFERDTTRALEILTAEVPQEVTLCPYCRSNNVLNSQPHYTSKRSLLNLIMMMLFLIPVPSPKKAFCKDCERYF